MAHCWTNSEAANASTTFALAVIARQRELALKLRLRGLTLELVISFWSWRPGLSESVSQAFHLGVLMPPPVGIRT